MLINIACAQHGFVTNCNHEESPEIEYQDHLPNEYDPDFEDWDWTWDSRINKWWRIKPQM